MKPLYYRSVSSKGASRPRLMHHHKGWWNETKWMRWVWRNGGIKFVVGENGRNPEKNLPRPRFVHHETDMEGPRCELGTPAVGGEHLTACATRPPLYNRLFLKCILMVTRLLPLVILLIWSWKCWGPGEVNGTSDIQLELSQNDEHWIYNSCALSYQLSALVNVSY